MPPIPDPASAALASVPATSGTAERRVAAIDIGTNSIHLLVAAIDPVLGSFSVVLAEKSTTRLGERDPDSGDLTPEAIERAFLTLRHCRDLATSHGVEQIVTAATSAVREAPNGRSFLQGLQDQLGLAVDLVSGPEEARLIYLGVLSGLSFGDQPYFILDIGGGSTELVLADGRDARALTSTRIGAVRLQREFCREDPLTPARRGFLEAYIQGAMDPAVAEVKRELRPGEKPVLVATSGTAMAMAALASAQDPNPPLKLDGYRLGRARLDGIVERLVGMTPEQRRALTAINERRAEIIVPGALILQTTMEILHVRELVVCERALREGLIVDWMLRNGLLVDRFSFQSTIRRRTVLHLARTYGVDTVRADRVASHALSLYDQTRGLLHDDDGDGRALLWAAAQLHACGKHVNIAAYHKHTWYLIRHGELLGYSESEHLMVAAIARYHRRSLPKKRHESWQLIEAGQHRHSVFTMALLLRLAAALDRRPAPGIEAISVSADAERTAQSRGFTISLLASAPQPGEPPQDLGLEEWSLRSCADLVLEATGLRLTVRQVSP
ncbi:MULTISPECIES: Ppx/GppA phosphatase family protein [unclassified Cyanobium]|uniref:Ppx/GppA phosphatase family protein n=1 Tax=unclassified Cyanobium TaxID=2627006 RepID=UPI0020CE7510|nr:MULTISPECIES: Ppx/GppA phosphatase family protein [unclassified Cyanobium]MCP9858421.1 Ppx/GppA family phosphatase [Cyanobium sp. Cruz-8H5]MCP9865495.1 Ppx/GppA family phosphatase [Cyanobium sp. Cruz-8D1]